MKASRLDLADSALHAPAAGFEDEDFYPDIVDKAAVLTCLAWNRTDAVVEYMRHAPNG
jgi:death on curing protein